MNCCKIILQETTDKLPEGCSKMFGEPDLPLEWVCEDDFFGDGVFLAQINLKEVSLDLLPSKGMLYFFVQLEGYPPTGTVYYYEENGPFVSFDFNENDAPGYNLNVEFSMAFQSTEPESSGMKLLGRPAFTQNSFPEEEIPLLQYDPLDHHSLPLFTHIDGFVYFIIHREDLAKELFEKAYLHVERT